MELTLGEDANNLAQEKESDTKNTQGQGNIQESWLISGKPTQNPGFKADQHSSAS